VKPVVVFGSTGMLGHRLCRQLVAENVPFVGVSRREGFDASRPVELEALLGELDPSVVVNCIGVVKQKSEAKEAVPSILVNALFPHRLAAACRQVGVRLIHLSTDCVFSGRTGGYRDSDVPDPIDLYGRSKLLGEVTEGGLTLRTSMIGWELSAHHSLLEWFAGQRGKKVRGYRRAIFSGLSTPVLAALIVSLSRHDFGLDGVYQVAADPISKYDLLVGLRDALGWQDVEIEPDEDFACDRSLDGSRFRQATGFSAPPWAEMLRELAEEWPTYAALKEKA
jgi:dTDP-4-dehydrorhamnose reductase